MNTTSGVTLRQRYEGTKKSTPPKPESAIRREPVDPLAKWLGRSVHVTFMSERVLEGKLTALGRFDFEITDNEEVQHHVCKHAVERICLRK